MEWRRGTYGGGWWLATDHGANDRIRARAAAAMAFLERYTGTDSRWSQAAHDDLEGLGRSRAGLMAQQVNLFLGRLEEVVQKAL